MEDAKYVGAWIIGGIVAVALIIGVIFAGWQLNWWFTTHDNTRTAQMFQNSYGTQSADVTQVRQGITDITKVDVQLNDANTPAAEKSSLESQRAAEVTQNCSVAGNITLNPMPADIARWMATNCG